MPRTKRRPILWSSLAICWVPFRPLNNQCWTKRNQRKSPKDKPQRSICPIPSSADFHGSLICGKTRKAYTLILHDGQQPAGMRQQRRPYKLSGQAKAVHSWRPWALEEVPAEQTLCLLPRITVQLLWGSEFTSLSLVHLIYTIGITSPIWEYYNSKRFHHMCVHQHIESVKWTAITPPLKLFKEEGSPSLGLSIIRLFKIEEWDMNYFYSIALISFYWFVEK